MSCALQMRIPVSKSAGFRNIAGVGVSSVPNYRIWLIAIPQSGLTFWDFQSHTTIYL